MMPSYPRIPISRTLISAAAALCLASGPALQAADEIRNPIPEPIPVGDLAVKLQPFAILPFTNGSPPRMNMLKPAYDGSGRLFVNDQRGPLFAIDEEGNVTEYLDLRDSVGVYNPWEEGQMGFSSFAFHPEFESNGIFFVVVSADKSQTADFPSKRPILNSEGRAVEPNHHDILVRFTADDPSAETFSGTWEEIMRFEEPFKDHNIGEIAFNPYAEPGDPDYGLLYIAASDGGSDGFPVSDTDPLDNGQDRTTPLGSILRIDPLGTNSANGKYGIPSSNPYALSGGEELGEIYAYGLRNPHRMSWDPETGKMYAFDIGQWYIEEINVIERGGNYGWGNREGIWLIDENNEFVLYPLPDNDFVFGYDYPVAIWDHPGDASRPWTGAGAIAGGYVYRGVSMPQFYGKLITADFSNASDFYYLDAADIEGLSNGETAPIFKLTLFDENDTQSTSSRIIRNEFGERTDVRFGIDQRGEIYVTNKHNRIVYKVVSPPDAPVYQLSESEKGAPQQGGEFSIDLTIDDASADWRILVEPEWLTLETSSEGTGNTTVRLTAEPNNSDDSREGSVFIGGAELRVFQYGLVSMPVYFPGASLLSADRWIVEWYGELDAEGFPWVVHEYHGWQYFETGGDNLYYYEWGRGWFFTTPSYYPWVYDFQQDGWLFYLEPTENPRWFFSWNAADWISDAG